MKPASYYYPADRNGPIPPLWWYVLNGKGRRWALISLAQIAWIGVLLLHGARQWVWEWSAIAIWFGLGVQWRGIWQQHLDGKAQRREHEMHMGWFDRQFDLEIEALQNGYSYEWLKMRRGHDPAWLIEQRRDIHATR